MSVAVADDTLCRLVAWKSSKGLVDGSCGVEPCRECEHRESLERERERESSRGHWDIATFNTQRNAQDTGTATFSTGWGHTFFLSGGGWWGRSLTWQSRKNYLLPSCRVAGQVPFQSPALTHKQDKGRPAPMAHGLWPQGNSGNHTVWIATPATGCTVTPPSLSLAASHFRRSELGASERKDGGMRCPLLFWDIE